MTCIFTVASATPIPAVISAFGNNERRRSMVDRYVAGLFAGRSRMSAEVRELHLGADQ